MKSGTIWTYPWDVADEGADRVVGKLHDAGLGGVSLAAAYHAGKFVLPHNPRRKVYFPEDGAVYFKPRLRYGKLKPRVSRFAGVWNQVRKAAARRATKLTAWTVCFHNSWLGGQFPEACVENAFGDRILHTLCPSNPDARKYVLTMVRDLASQEPDVIELESLDFMTYDHGYHHELALIPLPPDAKFLLGLCFCRHCGGGEVRGEVRKRLGAFFEGPASEPADPRGEFEAFAEAYQANRVRVIRELVEEIRVFFPGELRVILEREPWKVGVEPSRVPAHAFTVLAYTKDPEEARRMTAPYRGFELVAGLRACLPVENAFQLKAVADATGCERFSFYNYGFMYEEALGWIRGCLA